MSYAKPLHSRNLVNTAGEIMISPEKHTTRDRLAALVIFTNWRASHSYPINTFQATLRRKLKKICKNALVAQRLKRESSILLKLKRFEHMKLARMQDIGGLRAIVSSVSEANKLALSYIKSQRLDHKLITHTNYIKKPKADGYRSIHLVYKYNSSNAPEYNGLSVEIQIRTRLQHAWATAVETMGTFLGQALKSGQGDEIWKDFFIKASAALAIIEKTEPVPSFENRTQAEVFKSLAESEHALSVLDKLRGFSLAAENIKTENSPFNRHRIRGHYYLVILDSENLSVRIHPFMREQLDIANEEYTKIEEQTKAGGKIEAVLVSVDSISALKKAYPNYFLDTQEFVRQIQKIIALAPTEK